MEATPQPKKISPQLRLKLAALAGMLFILATILILSLTHPRGKMGTLPITGPAAGTSGTNTNVLSLGEAFASAKTGNSLAQQGKLLEAIENLKKVVQAHPDDAEARLSLARSLRFAGEALRDYARFQEAMVQYAEAVRLNPRDAMARKGLIISQIDLTQSSAEETKKQRDDLLQMLAAHPEDSELLYYLGLCQQLLNQVEEAVASYRKAIQLNPAWHRPYNELAWILATSPRDDLRNGPEAVKLAEAACQLSQGSRLLYFGTLDAAYAEAGRFEEAIKMATATAKDADNAGIVWIARQARIRLEYYEQKKPYHEL